MKFAASTGGFYSPDIHGDAIPSDAVDITDTLYAQILDGQAAGKQVVAGKGGKPALADPILSDADLLAACKRTARARLVATDYTQTPDVTAALKNAADFTSYRTAVRNLFLNPMKDPTWPEEPVPAWQ